MLLLEDPENDIVSGRAVTKNEKNGYREIAVIRKLAL